VVAIVPCPAPGHEVVVRREPTEGDLHTGLAPVIRNAFTAARRRLRDLSMKQRGEVKRHAAASEARTVKEMGAEPESASLAAAGRDER